MAPIQLSSPAGIVFRRLDAAGDRRRALRLLEDCPVDARDPAAAWFGLDDLTVAEPGALLGVVVVRPVDATTLRWCALAVSRQLRGRGLERRLVSEVADRLHAAGFEQVLAPPTADSGVAAVLARAGFRARQPGQAGEPGWSALAL